MPMRRGTHETQATQPTLIRNRCSALTVGRLMTIILAKKGWDCRIVSQGFCWNLGALEI